jgi:hypothetical protein
MNNNKNKKKDTRILLEEGAKYQIDGLEYEIIEVTSQYTYASRINTEGEQYGRVIRLGSLRNKRISKID